MYKAHSIILVYNYIPDEGALAICDALENRKQHLTYFNMCKYQLFFWKRR